MSHHHAPKPESALKRAEELIGQKLQSKALDVLLALVTSRKNKQPWSKMNEKVMFKFLDLCIELRRAKAARDGLQQYRNLTQTQVPQSLETVLKYFLDKASKAAAEAQQKALSLASDLDDLDEEAAEDAILRAVSGEESKARSERLVEREVVLPWLRFLWETFRTVLDCIRNNPKLEGLYKTTTDQAFKFCRDYKRINEFKRLNDLLRNHLSNMSKYHQTQLETEATLQFQLEIRLSQLTTASHLELWQDAFRTVEDINGLVQLYKKTPPVAMMVTYYEKLADIMLVSENYTFHTFSLLKFYELSKELKRDEAFLREVGSQLLISALAIPLQFGEDEDFFVDHDIQRERNARLAPLLGYNISDSKRDSVLTEVLARNVQTNLLPELSGAYALLEEKFSPLKLSGELHTLLKFIDSNDKLKKYHSLIQGVGFVRLLQQLSQVYQTMKLERLLKMVPYVARHDVEKMIALALKHKHIEGRIDHRKGAISFGAQSFESESVRNSLTTVARNLQKVIAIIHPDRKAQEAARKKAEFVKIAQTLEADHKRMLHRREQIQRVAQLREDKQAYENRQRDAAIQAAKDAEDAAEQLRKQKRDADKAAVAKAQEDAQKRDTERRAVLDRLGEIAPSLKLPAPESLPADLEAATLAATYARKILAEREKMDRNLKATAERLEHLVRARRERELPLYKANAAKKADSDKAYLETTWKGLREGHKKAWEEQIKEKERVAKMQGDRKALVDQVMAKRRQIYDDLKKQRDEALTKARAERDKKRKEDEERRAVLEKERKAKDDESRLAREADNERKRQEEAKFREEQEKQLVEQKAQESKGWRRETPLPASPAPGPAASDTGRWRKDTPAGAPADDTKPRGERWGQSVSAKFNPPAGEPSRPPATGGRFASDGPPSGRFASDSASSGGGWRDKPAAPAGGDREAPVSRFAEDRPQSSAPPRDEGRSSWRDRPTQPPRDQPPRDGPRLGGRFSDNAPPSGGRFSGSSESSGPRPGGRFSDNAPSSAPPRDSGPRDDRGPRDGPRGPPSDSSRPGGRFSNNAGPRDEAPRGDGPRGPPAGGSRPGGRFTNNAAPSEGNKEGGDDNDGWTTVQSGRGSGSSSGGSGAPVRGRFSGK